MGARSFLEIYMGPSGPSDVWLLIRQTLDFHSQLTLWGGTAEPQLAPQSDMSWLTFPPMESLGQTRRGVAAPNSMGLTLDHLVPDRMPVLSLNLSPISHPTLRQHIRRKENNSIH